MGIAHQLHGADFDIALDVGRHSCEQSDHPYGQGAPDKLFLHFHSPHFCECDFSDSDSKLALDVRPAS
jgi:hypothetical protein